MYLELFHATEHINTHLKNETGSFAVIHLVC